MSSEVPKMSDNKSFDLDLKLIKAVQKRPYLFDKNTYTVAQNDSFVSNAWSKISKEVKLPLDECASRWTYLRNRYARARHSTWDLAPYLSFLEPYIKRRPKKDKCDLSNDCTAVPSNVKHTGSQFQGTFVMTKPPTPSKGQKKSEKLDEHVRTLQLPSSSLMLERQLSNQSFCESLSNDMQTLTADQQMKCRIDILQLVDKYKNPTNNKKKPKSDTENNQSNAVVFDLFKKFGAVVEKISYGRMTSYDQDWYLIFTVKSFFCQLLNMRNVSVELDRMLSSFTFADSTIVANVPQIHVAEKIPDFERLSVLETQNYPMNFVAPQNFVQNAQEPFYKNNPYLGEDEDVKAQPDIKAEPKHSDEAYAFAAGDASISAEENIDRENETHLTLKNLHVTEGMMKVNHHKYYLCVLCDVYSGENVYSNHTKMPYHQDLMKEYTAKSENVKDTAILQLDPSVYSYQFGGLYCIKCDAKLTNRNNFLTHVKSLRHKNQLKTLPISLDQDMLGVRDVGKGIVQINECNFCVLCNVKIFGNPSIMHAMSPNHIKAVALFEGLFKLSLNHGYCIYCNEVFLLSQLDLHQSQKKHVSKVMNELDAVIL